MRMANIAAIMRKELLDLFRDRRSVISMLVVPLLIFPLLISGIARLMPKLQQRAEEDLQSMGIAALVSNPSARAALEKLGLKIAETDGVYRRFCNHCSNLVASR